MIPWKIGSGVATLGVAILVLASGSPGSDDPLPPGIKRAVVKKGATATFRGRVVFDGEPPERKVLIHEGQDVKDSAIMAQEDRLSERLIVDPETRGVKNTLIFLPGVAVGPDSVRDRAETDHPEAHAHRGRYRPHLLTVPAGGRVMIVNDDPAGHNFHSRSQINAFNYGFLPAAGRESPVLWNESEPFAVVCDIHPWERVYWFVSESPYVAVTDEQGRFSIPDVPAGKQRVAVWHESAGWLTPRGGTEVLIKPAGATDWTFTFEPIRVKPGW